MAIPALEHQIRFVDSIVLAKAEEISQGKFKYIVQEVIKSRHNTLRDGDSLKADLSIFELLGYTIHDGQLSLVFLAAKSDGFDCIDFLPVTGNRFEYGASDPAVLRRSTMDEFRELCAREASRTG